MKINTEILDALRKAIDTVGSASRLSRAAGVNRSLVSRYLSSQVKYISDENWEKIRPLIISYLDADRLELRGEAAFCPDKENCPLQNEEDREILRYYSRPQNRLQRYKLLLQIEEEKMRGKEASKSR